jgi:multiple sugar transport system substrate-binding protein
MNKRLKGIGASAATATMLAGLWSVGADFHHQAQAAARKDSEPVTITYWQYTFPAKVTAIKALIAQFEKQNRNIKVIEQDFPYDQYNQKVAAAMHAGQGPDILNLYYGWIPQYVQQGYLQPIPADFMSTKAIDKYYEPIVHDSKLNGKYYALPIAVRSLALVYNKDLFKAAGLDPNKPPRTWDELISYAKKMTIRNANGQLVQQGFSWDIAGQGYHVLEEVLLRQWGVTPFSKDGKKVLFNSSPNGLAAFKYYMDMETKEKIGEPTFITDYSTSFKAGKSAMMIDGSFDIATLKKACKFNWGVAPMPVKQLGGVKSNFGSFWCNGIAKGVSGAKLKAAEKFLQFLISKKTEMYWLNAVGELPAANMVSESKLVSSNPLYGPFVQGLKYSHATFFVDEPKERQVWIDGTNQILLNNVPVEQAWNYIVTQSQALRDKYFNSIG